MQTPQVHPLNILLADDDSDDRYFFAEAIKEIPIPIRLNQVVDGEHLMDYLSSNIGNLPSALFLDLNMPRKSGKECLRELKTNQQLKGIPVIIHSTSCNIDEVDDLYAIGAHYYLHKDGYAELPGGVELALDLLLANPNQPSRSDFLLELNHGLVGSE